MSYSDLLTRQQKELELLNQAYYADQATVKNLRNYHYDKSRFDGQLERLQELHERQVKEIETRFVQEQRIYLGEPEPPVPSPDISQSQDKAVDMIKAYRQQQSESRADRQQDKNGDQQANQPQTVKAPPVDEAEVKKLAQQAWERREEKNQQRQRGFRR